MCVMGEVMALLGQFRAHPCVAILYSVSFWSASAHVQTNLDCFSLFLILQVPVESCDDHVCYNRGRVITDSDDGTCGCNCRRRFTGEQCQTRSTVCLHTMYGIYDMVMVPWCHGAIMSWCHWVLALWSHNDLLS